MVWLTSWKKYIIVYGIFLVPTATLLRSIVLDSKVFSPVRLSLAEIKKLDD